MTAIHDKRPGLCQATATGEMRQQIGMSTILRSILLAIVLSHCESWAGQSRSSQMKEDLVLHGSSSGGSLTLTKTPFSTKPYVIVTNEPGLPAGVVISRLAAQLDASEACKDHWGPPQLAGDTLSMFGISGAIILGGTETGFGIPQPPTSVSVRRDANGLTVFWENPTVGYDQVAVLRKGEVLRRLPGDVTSWLIPSDYLRRTDYGPTNEDAFMVVGYKSGTPSNGAGVRAKEDYRWQESQMNVPFTMNIAPGFKQWQEPNGGTPVNFEQGTLVGYGMGPGEERFPVPWNKFYQILKGQGSFHGGVSRRFLGLSPGHTYRVSARLNTPTFFPQGDWSFSFHAAYNSPAGEDLTPAQMAGNAGLPDKTKGPTAGLIARVSGKESNRGAWVGYWSAQPALGQNVGEIVLPDSGVDSITLWFRLDGSNAPAVSGQFDSVTIEDLGKK